MQTFLFFCHSYICHWLSFFSGGHAVCVGDVENELSCLEMNINESCIGIWIRVPILSALSVDIFKRPLLLFVKLSQSSPDDQEQSCIVSSPLKTWLASAQRSAYSLSDIDFFLRVTTLVPQREWSVSDAPCRNLVCQAACQFDSYFFLFFQQAVKVPHSSIPLPL